MVLLVWIVSGTIPCNADGPTRRDIQVILANDLKGPFLFRWYLRHYVSAKYLICEINSSLADMK